MGDTTRSGTGSVELTVPTEPAEVRWLGLMLLDACHFYDRRGLSGAPSSQCPSGGPLLLLGTPFSHYRMHVAQHQYAVEPSLSSMS